MAIAKYKNLSFEYEKEVINVRSLEPITHGDAREILFKTQDILKSCGIDIYLCFGTLLGAIREMDFIKGDTDADVYVKDEKRVFENLEYLKQNGLKLVRYKPHTEFTFRLESKSKYFIDIFIIGKASGIWSFHCYKLNKWVVPKRYVKEDDVINFLGREFKVAKNPERLLAFWYGDTWRTPIGKFEGHFMYDVKSHYYWRKYKRKFLNSKFYKVLRAPIALLTGREDMK